MERNLGHDINVTQRNHFSRETVYFGGHMVHFGGKMVNFIIKFVCGESDKYELCAASSMSRLYINISP